MSNRRGYGSPPVQSNNSSNHNSSNRPPVAPYNPRANDDSYTRPQTFVHPSQVTSQPKPKRQKTAAPTDYPGVYPGISPPPPLPPPTTPNYATLQSLSTQLSLRDAEITRLVALLLSRDAEIAQLRATIADPTEHAAAIALAHAPKFSKVYFPRLGANFINGKEEMVDAIASLCRVPRNKVRRNMKHDMEAYSDVWVTFDTAKEADWVIKTFQGSTFGGKEINCSLARFQGGTKKEEQIDRSKIEKLAYGVGGHYLEEDCKVHVTSNDFVQDLAGSFYAMCASQVPPINLVDFRQKPKKKIAAGDRGEFDGYGWFSDPMERDRAVNILDNQRDGNNCTIIVSKFVHKSERGMK